MSWEDDTMAENAEDFAEKIVGHRIVKVEATEEGRWHGGIQFTLDDGRVVELGDTSDCCAYTVLEDFKVLADLSEVDHVITAVTTEDGYQKWHIYASGIPVVDLDVAWSEGSGYYGFGFSITVKDKEEA